MDILAAVKDQNQEKLAFFVYDSNAYKYLYQEIPGANYEAYINNAIARETEIKGWSREKKYDLIRTMNPELKFLNEEL